MKIQVQRTTSPDLYRHCAEVTTGKPCTMQWRRAIASEHSIIRAQQYLVKMQGIPLSAAQHLVRHTHAQPFMRSSRPDRGGESFPQVCNEISAQLLAADSYDLYRCAKAVEQLPERFGRDAPTDLALLLNAQEIINISKVRLCAKAAPETRAVWQAVIGELAKVDPDLALFCVPTCCYRGGICPEPKGCGHNRTDLFQKQLQNYRKLFVK